MNRMTLNYNTNNFKFYFYLFHFVLTFLAVSIRGAWYVDLVGNDGANVFDNCRPMLIQIDIHKWAVAF